MEQSTIAVSKETLAKLGVIAQKSGLTKVEIITDFIDSLSKLIKDARPDTAKISLTNWNIDLKRGIMEISFANLFDIGELPRFIQDFYTLERKIEDAELSGKIYTKEELLAEGFDIADIEILLKEQSARFQKSQPKKEEVI